MSEPSIYIESVEVVAYPLIDRFYKAQGQGDRCKRHDKVWAVRDQGTLIATARLSPMEGQWILRGVWVAPSYRHQRIASELITQMIADHPGEIHCFALPHLATFYGRLGWQLCQPKPVLEGVFSAYRRSQPQLLSFRRLPGSESA